MSLALVIKSEDERLFCARDWILINRLAVHLEDSDTDEPTQPIDDGSEDGNGEDVEDDSRA